MKGKLWGEATLSPGKRWLLLRSYDDKDWIKLRSPFELGPEPIVRGGPTYVQIYDVRMGELVFAAQSRNMDSIVGGTAQWVGDEYVLQPADFLRRALFVVLPSRGSGH